ncbi:MAG: NAD-dependent epimerase, partial [Flavobacterium sp.]|nr:NAD-dependent epimerase [Flavobacterium sp.]
IEAIEICTDKKVQKEMLPMQPGDVEKTWADVSPLQEDYSYNPIVDINEGVPHFINWYKNYYL